MSGGPPTQSEIDYSCPVQQMRRPDGSWSLRVVVLLILAAIAFGFVWGLQ
jgi:hypothetical protein